RIDAEITRRCNLNCIFCSRRASSIDLNEESKKIEMKDERWIGLVKESGELGVKEWNISGIGEPNLRPNLLSKMMELIKAYDMFGEITTNGTCWKDEEIKKVVEIQWDSVCISIDAPNEKLHEYFRRVKGCFKQVVNTTKKFSYWKKKLRSRLPIITINVVLNKKNYMFIPKIVELGGKLGVDAVFVEPMVLFSKIAAPLKLKEKEIKLLPKYIQEAMQVGEKLGIALTISPISVDRSYDEDLVKNVGEARKILKNTKENDKLLSIPCYHPWLSLMIRVDGTTIPCGELERFKDNVREKSLEEVWYGPNMNKIRESFLSGIIPYECDKCRPNIINDMKEIKKTIKKFRNLEELRNEILDLLKENKKLRDYILFLNSNVKNCWKDEIEEEELRKELIRYKNSISYRISKKLEKTWLGRGLRKLLGVYL
ncbi:MAG: radical SAM protein, partial [Candidatus Aenigmatarchaeota archaeon]